MQTASTKSEPAAEEQIRSAPCPICFLCGSSGEVIYQGQRDRLFGAWGSWSFKRCANPKCGSIWLDPMPLMEDIGKAYANYYTHKPQNDSGGTGLLKKVYRLMQAGYLSAKYGYRTKGGSLVAGILGKLFYLFPLRRRGLDGDVRFLPAMPGGRVLDVGCGSGDWLIAMQQLGWQVEGVDFDENAVLTARQRGLKVGTGSVAQQEYAAASFDAVVLCHVIEHVPDPVETLKECARILRPGGRLVLLTPNTDSLSHRIFKQNWRGLEPPRHLHLFSNASMRLLLERSGFGRSSIHSHIARSVVYESLQLRRAAAGSPAGSARSLAILTRLFNLVELLLLKFDPAIADCVAAVAIKEQNS